MVTKGEPKNSIRFEILKELVYSKGTAALFLNEGFQVLSISQTAQDFLNKSNVLNIENRKLTCENGKQSRRLARCFHSAKEKNQKEIIFLESSLTNDLHRIEIRPFGIGQIPVLSNYSYLVIELKKMVDEPYLLLPQLEDHYDFKFDEIELINLLVGGNSPEECASKNNKSLDEVYSMIEGIYLKTNTNSHSQLIGVISQFRG